MQLIAEHRCGRSSIGAMVIVAMVIAVAGTLAYFGLQSPQTSPMPTGASQPIGGTPAAKPAASDAASPAAASGRPADPRVVSEIISAVDAYQSDGEHEKARVALAAAVQTYPTDQPLRIRLARVLGMVARHEEAHEQYEKAIAIGPRTAQVEFEAGTMANAAGLVQRSLEHYAAAQALDATNADYPLFLAQIQRKLGQIEAAKASLALSGKLRPDTPTVWASLAEIALEENKASVARQYIAKARALDPRSDSWRMIEARALNRLGKPADALATLDGVSTPEQSNRSVARLKGESLGMLGRVKDAAEMFAAAADARPDDAELALDAATWLERAGDVARALPYATRATMLGNKTAADLQRRLKGSP